MQLSFQEHNYLVYCSQEIVKYCIRLQIGNCDHDVIKDDNEVAQIAMLS